MAKPRRPETVSVGCRMTRDAVRQLAIIVDLEETNVATFVARAVSDAIAVRRNALMAAGSKH